MACWVLASGASEEGKLLAQEEIVLVLDERTGFFSSTEYGRIRCTNNIYLIKIENATKCGVLQTSKETLLFVDWFVLILNFVCLSTVSV